MNTSLTSSNRVRRQINPKLEIEGILMTMVNSRTNYAKEIRSLLIGTYGDKVKIFENIIPISAKAAEIPATGISIYAHNLKGRVAAAYAGLAKEVLSDG